MTWFCIWNEIILNQNTSNNRKTQPHPGVLFPHRIEKFYFFSAKNWFLAEHLACSCLPAIIFCEYFPIFCGLLYCGRENLSGKSQWVSKPWNTCWMICKAVYTLNLTLFSMCLLSVSFFRYCHKEWTLNGRHTSSNRFF